MKRPVTSLDRHVTLDVELGTPDRYREVLALAPAGPMIARGAGLSYVAASFGEGAVSVGMTRFDRVLALDEGARRAEVEAGISLGRLQEVLAPRGLQVAVQPGYPDITVGGCIAGNVHGKNHYREGVFAGVVESLRLFHPVHGLITASANENAEVFELTIGGLGLTGLILAATLRLIPLPGTVVEVEHIPVASPQEACAHIGRLREECDMLYAWLDFSRRGARMGRGYVVAGRWIDESRIDVSGAVTARARPRALDPSAARLRPNVFGVAMGAINEVYYRIGTRRPLRRRTPMLDVLYPAVGKEFYFDFFGRRGFIEHQSLIPETMIGTHLEAFRALFLRHGQPVALATLKAGRGAARLLHYDGCGYSFTIDVAPTREGVALLADLDQATIRHGGRTSIMKDSRLPVDVVRAEYPEYDVFRDRLRAYDPRRLFRSAVSQRLEL
ncbi:MAG: FAD-binding oxidoreductase [Alphaproteobacteria bacterium]